ncbi:MAG TPA: hypothetical protein VE993_21765 [Stellaceae bacterium]|nr:hypothetical protein [Stellaceae bacterium]
MSDTLSLVKRIREWSAAKGYAMSEDAAVEAIEAVRREAAQAMWRRCAEVAGRYEREILQSKKEIFLTDREKGAAEMAGIIWHEIRALWRELPLNEEPKR